MAPRRVTSLPGGTVAISVIVADDHLVVRDALVAMIGRAPGLEVVAFASDGQEVLERVDELRPKVVVLDIEMPRMTGIEVARQVRDRGLHTAVVLLSVHTEAGFVKAALEA